MTTITLWLLISVGSGRHDGYPTTVVERFATESACIQVARAAYDGRSYDRPALRCIQATVVRP